MYTKPFVTSPIVGVSKIEQLHDLMGAINVKLTEEDIKYLEEPYTLLELLMSPKCTLWTCYNKKNKVNFVLLPPIYFLVKDK